MEQPDNFTIILMNRGLCSMWKNHTHLRHLLAMLQEVTGVDAIPFSPFVLFIIVIKFGWIFFL